MIKLNNSELNNVVGAGQGFCDGFKGKFKSEFDTAKVVFTGKNDEGNKVSKEGRIYFAGNFAADVLEKGAYVTVGALAAAGTLGTIYAIKNRNKIVGYFKNRFGKK